MEMLKRIRTFVLAIVLLVVALLAIDSLFYITYENEYSVVKEFSQIKYINTEPGINFRLPVIQTVSKIKKSKQFYDLPKSDVITSDKKTMIADAYVIWRVTDPKLFTSTLNANPATAEGRIDVIVYNAIKTTISNMTQEELIVSRDDPIDVANADADMSDVDIKDIDTDEIVAEMTKNADGVADGETGSNNTEVIAISKQILSCIGDQCEKYGLSIDDVEIKVLDLPDENKEAVYERMITERNNIAAAYKAQGESEAQIIRNTTDKEVSIMTSEAEASADKTVAQGEAEYMKILSDAYNDPAKADFYLFTKSLDTAKSSLTSSNTTLFLDKDSPIAQIFTGSGLLEAEAAGMTFEDVTEESAEQTEDKKENEE